MDQPSLLIDPDSLTSSPTSAAAAPSRARRRPDAPTPAQAPPVPPGSGFPTDPAGRAAWLLAGEASEVPRRFDALADVALAGELRALADARRAVDDAAASMSEAEAAIPDLERSLLREQNEATHAALGAAHTRVSIARDVLNLARRDVPNHEAHLAAARRALAVEMAAAAVAMVGGDTFRAAHVQPAAVRWWALVQQALAIRDDLRAALAAEGAKVAKVDALASLAGVASNVRGLDPYAIDVGLRDYLHEQARRGEDGLRDFLAALPTL